MTDHRLDTLARSLATSPSRRAVLRTALAAVGFAGLRRTTAAKGKACTGSNFECPGKQICGFDETTQQLQCSSLTGFDHSEGRICKGEFEFTFCQRGSQCCVYPEVRDPGGLQLVANCCDNGLVCDAELGCIPK